MFSVSSSSHPEKISLDNAFVVPNVNVRYHKIDINKITSSFPSFKDIESPKLNNPEVRILIGPDFSKLYIHKDFKYISDEDPCAVKTELGWVLLGGNKSSVHVQSNGISTGVKTLDLETFWSINSYGTVKKPDRILMAKDEKQAYDILEKDIFFRNEHYEVGMLWKDPNIHLKTNEVLAVQRLESLGKRLIKNRDQARQYSHTIKRYLEPGYATKLSIRESAPKNNLTYHIPHHYVTNPNKQNKFRVVFDASAKYPGTSLNDYLLKGPDLLNSLVIILLRFRNGKYSISPDIEKMFHQIFVKQNDRNYLRFLWRDNPNLVIDKYQMNIYIFGKNDSPCIRNFSLKQCAKDKQDEFSKVITESFDKYFYMDDFLKSGECVKDLIHIATQLLQLLSNEGFRLTKWISNSQIILDRLPTAELEIKNKIKDLTYENSFKKVLGLLWNVKSDTLKLPSNIKRITKIDLLSALCSVFDPLGFVAPCLIGPKLII